MDKQPQAKCTYPFFLILSWTVPLRKHVQWISASFTSKAVNGRSKTTGHQIFGQTIMTPNTECYSRSNQNICFLIRSFLSDTCDSSGWIKEIRRKSTAATQIKSLTWSLLCFFSPGLLNSIPTRSRKRKAPCSPESHYHTSIKVKSEAPPDSLDPPVNKRIWVINPLQKGQRSIEILVLLSSYQLDAPQQTYIFSQIRLRRTQTGCSCSRLHAVLCRIQIHVTAQNNESACAFAFQPIAVAPPRTFSTYGY